MANVEGRSLLFPDSSLHSALVISSLLKDLSFLHSFLKFSELSHWETSPHVFSRRLMEVFCRAEMTVCSEKFIRMLHSGRRTLVQRREGARQEESILRLGPGVQVRVPLAGKAWGLCKGLDHTLQS